MKKNFLFTILAVFLAGLGFGGISMAEDNKWTFDESVITTNGGTITDENTVEFSGLTINFSSADESIGRGFDGYRAPAARILTPNKFDSLDSMANVMYSKEKDFTNRLPWSNLADSESRNYLDVYVPIKAEYLANKKLKNRVEEGKYTFSAVYSFDNDKTEGDNHSDKQSFTIKLLANNITLKKDGDTIFKSEDGVVLVDDGQEMVAKIGNKSYATLAEAISGVKTGETITLLKDFNLGMYNSTKNEKFTIDFGGYTVTGCLGISAGEVTLKSGKISYNGTNVAPIVVRVGGKAILSEGFSAEGSGGAISLFQGGEVLIEGGTYTSTNNCVVMTNGANGQGDNKITIKGGTFTSSIEETGYIACGIYVANDDTVTVNGGTFNVTSGAGIVARGGTTTVKDGVVFNVTGDKNTKGKVGDSRVVVPQATNVVMDVAANYPGAESQDFKVTNELGETTIIVGGETTNTYTVKFGDDESEKTIELTKNGTSAKIAEPGENPEDKDGKRFEGWYNGNNKYVFDDEVSSNVELVSKWFNLISLVDAIKPAQKTTDAGDRENRNEGKFDFKYEIDESASNKATITITDVNLEKFLGGNGDVGAWLGLLVDFGASVIGKSNYSIEDGNGDRSDAKYYGGGDSETAFVMWLSEAKNGKTITFVNQADENDTVDVEVVFKPKQITFERAYPIDVAGWVKGDNEGIKTNGGKYTVSKTDNKIIVTDNGLTGYVGGNKQEPMKWVGILVDLGVVVEGVESYTIMPEDYSDAKRWGATNDTTFIMWITKEEGAKTYTFKNINDNDNTIQIEVEFKDKQQTSGSSGGGGGGGSSSSYSCKNLPANATANNKTTPKSNTNYSYDTDTSKVCTFQCNKGYSWNEKDSKCEKAEATTGNTTDEPKADEPKTDDNQSPLDDGLTQELHDAYDFAHENGVTTMPTAAEANMYGPLTRIAMAKMLSQYATNVLGQKPANIVVPEFPDVTAELNEEYSNAVTLAYQLGIMGINIQEFRPYDNATRAEFGTALSRMLFSTPDGEEYEGTAQYYVNHLKKLVEEKIITNANPNLQELRGYVMIMLMRAAE